MVGKARELFAAYIDGDHEAIPADLMEAVFRIVIRSSTNGHEMEQACIQGMSSMAVVERMGGDDGDVRSRACGNTLAPQRCMHHNLLHPSMRMMACNKERGGGSSSQW